MTAILFGSRTNEGRYKFLGSTSLVNAYAEQQGNDSKGQWVVLPAWGLVRFSSTTDTPCRGLIYLEDLDVIYTVHSSGVFKVTSDGTATRLGTVPGNDVVQISRNQKATPQVSIHCAAGEYYVESEAVHLVTDDDIPDDIVTQDYDKGVTIYGSSTGEFVISSINECSEVSGTDFATAEQSADKLLRVKSSGGDIFLFGQRTTEPWRNTGQASFPYEPIGSTIQKGLLATNAVVEADNTLLWPGHDGIVYRLTGASPQRISTHGIERTIGNEASQDSIIGFPYSYEGHSFAAFSGTDWTRAYDAATQQWHSRESYGLGRWRAQFAVRAWGKIIVGDTLSGNLYYLDKDEYTEDGDPLVWGVDSPPMHLFPNGGIVDAIHIDFATGYGRVLPTDQGYDPVLMLSWSTDGGNTFKGERLLKIGKSGDRVRVTARRLGRFGPAGIVWRIRVSDPVPRAIVNVDVQVRPLKR